MDAKVAKTFSSKKTSSRGDALVAGLSDSVKQTSKRTSSSSRCQFPEGCNEKARLEIRGLHEGGHRVEWSKKACGGHMLSMISSMLQIFVVLDEEE